MRVCPECKSERIFYSDTLYLTSIRVYEFNDRGQIDKSTMNTVEIKEMVGCKFVKCADCNWTHYFKDKE